MLLEKFKSTLISRTEGGGTKQTQPVNTHNEIKRTMGHITHLHFSRERKGYKILESIL